MKDSFSRIAAVILQYGNWKNTVECIESLLASTFLPRWIIVVDNFSPDNSAEYLADWLSSTGACLINEFKDNGGQVLFRRLASNRGYAAGNNVGLDLALGLGADAALIINNDACVSSTALEQMRASLLNSARPGICGPLLVYSYDKATVQCCGGGHTNYLTGLSSFFGAGLSVEESLRLTSSDVTPHLNFICGACQLISRDFINVVGLMDEGYFLYCEEQDWALAAKGRFDLVFAPKAIVYHHEGATTGWSRRKFAVKPALRLARSRLRLAFRHHPYYLPTVAICCFWALCKKVAGKLFYGKTGTRINNNSR